MTIKHALVILFLNRKLRITLGVQTRYWKAALMLRQADHILVISSCFLHKCILVLRQQSLGPGTRIARIQVKFVIRSKNGAFDGASVCETGLLSYFSQNWRNVVGFSANSTNIHKIWQRQYFRILQDFAIILC